MVSGMANSPGLRQRASDILLATMMNSANLIRESPRPLCNQWVKRSSFSSWAVWCMGGNAWTWYNHFVFKRESNLSRKLAQREEKNWEKWRKKQIQSFDQAMPEAWATSVCFSQRSPYTPFAVEASLGWLSYYLQPKASWHQMIHWNPVFHFGGECEGTQTKWQKLNVLLEIYSQLDSGSWSQG